MLKHKIWTSKEPSVASNKA